MVCEEEKINVELLEILVDAAYNEYDGLQILSWELFGSFAGMCMELELDRPIGTGNLEYIMASLLIDLEEEGLTEECQVSFEEWLQAFRDREEAYDFLQNTRAALREALNRYEECKHKQNSGLPSVTPA